ncbi:MAG: SDR family NAD(P)-dependent oxidoreductase [Burkholderiales bacterium]|nr:SDR family NAD(P)-dependent oxidoreductase [Burkholderiales bacterium]
MTTLFPSGYRALVVGASGAIGHAFVNALQLDPQCTHVEMVSRSQDSRFDLLDTASLAAQAKASAGAGPYRLIVDATGALTIDGVGPEKSLAAVQPDVLAKSYALNAIAPLMVLRQFAPLLAPGPSIYAKLSARVGSITDNHMGGWYGYRASKAALNMLLQTAAIELQRKQPELRVVALQPGTVRSNLSRPFAASVAKLLEPSESVTGMLAALQGLTVRKGAHFVDYQGNDIPW